MATGPLSGIRVIELATEIGEYAGRVLADLGAEVITIEPPGGAPSRRLPPFIQGRDMDPNGSLYWRTVARGKRSLVLDLQRSENRDHLHTLARTADAFIESFPPGTLPALGLGYDHLRTDNPALIYCSISPYGQDGPDAHRPASDLSIQAAGGLINMQGDWDRPPVPVGAMHQSWFHAGAQAAADIIISLNERHRSGHGQYLDTSAQAAVVWTLMNATGYPSCEGADPPGYGADRGDGATSAMKAFLQRMGIDVDLPITWPCQDGYIISILLPRDPHARAIPGFLRWMHEEALLPEHARDLLDINWSTWLAEFEAGQRNDSTYRRALQIIPPFFLTKTKRALQDRGYREDLFIAPIYSTKDLWEDPQLRARDFWVQAGGLTHPGAFAKFSATPLDLSAPAPALDEGCALLGSAHAPLAPAITGSRRHLPFAGLKIADFSWIGVGPIVAKALADHGATVVHIESSRRPDGLRLGPPFRDGVMDLDLSQFFANFNSSKQSIALDISMPEGRAIARKLIDWADVVAESFTPGTMKKLGFDYATIRQEHPDLIMFSTCLRGQTGPEASLAGFGNQGATLAGLHHITGWPDRPPTGPWGAYTDFITPRFAVAALAAAVHHRARTGQGQHVDVAQAECGIRFLEPDLLDYIVNGHVAEAPGDKSPLVCPGGVYPARGKERYLALSVATPEQWHALRRLAPLDAFTNPALDPLPARRAQEAHIDAALRAWIGAQDAFDLAARLAQAGVPASPVLRPSDLYRDPQLAHRQFFPILNHTKMGPTPYDGFATRFSAIPSQPRFAGPCLGEHTFQVLRDLLNLGEEEIAAAAAAIA